MPGLNMPFFPLKVILFLAAPICLVASRLPRRPGFAGRAACAFLAVVASVAAATYACVALGLSDAGATVREIIVFSVTMLAFAAGITYACDAHFSAALFCATAGYAMQNLASGLELLVLMLASGASTGASPSDAPLLGPVVTLAVCGLSYLAFVRRIEGTALAALSNAPMLLMFAVVSLAIIGADVLIKSITGSGISFSHAVLLRLLHALICVFVIFAEYQILYASQLRADKAATERILAEKGRQYELSRANIEAINVRLHDIRHQIRTAGQATALSELAEEVNVYDSFIDTGCDALDVVLTEKRLLCSGEGIELSCVADGSGLSGLSAADIYSLFGNALDNAMEAARAQDDPERRTISLVVRRRGAMTSVRVENYVAPGAAPVFVGGLPQTTKPDRSLHGFGMRSMQLVAERHGGSLAARVDGDVFRLSVLLPIEAVDNFID